MERRSDRRPVRPAEAAIVVNQDLLDLALGANRVLTYAGYVLLAGTLTFLERRVAGRSQESPPYRARSGRNRSNDHRDSCRTCHSAGLRRQAAWRHRHPAGRRRPAGQARRTPSCCLLPPRHHHWFGGWVGAFALNLVVVIADTMVAQSNAIGGHWEIAKIAATGLHVLATCAWLGGLVALAAVLIPGDKIQELDQLIPRFSRVAQLSVITLVVTGTVHAVAVAGGLTELTRSRYGLVLLIKISIFGLMLLMGNHGRKYAIRAAFRQLHQPPDAPARSGGISALAVAMGAELSIAFVILSTTALLVMVAPHP